MYVVTHLHIQTTFCIKVHPVPMRGERWRENYNLAKHYRKSKIIVAWFLSPRNCPIRFQDVIASTKVQRYKCFMVTDLGIIVY